MPAIGTVKIDINIVESVSAGSAGGELATLLHKVASNQEFASGVTDGSIDIVWGLSNQSVTTGSADLDVRGGLTSKLNGATLGFVEICGIYVANKSAVGSGNLLIGGATSNAIASLFGATNDVLVVRPQTSFLLSCMGDGYTTTAATADLLKIVSSSGTVTADVLIWGRSS